MTSQRAILFAIGASLGLSGCVAAVIPLAASGVIGRNKLRHQKQPTTAPAEHASPTPATMVTTPVPAPPLPAVRPATTARQADPGVPPPPAGAGVAVAADAPSVDRAGRSPTTAWSDVMRFAAAASLQKPTASALLARGSTTATPRWLACGDKPLAVLVVLPVAGPTTFFDDAMENLSAIDTMGVALLFMSDQPPSVVARQRGRLKAGGVTAPVAGTTLFVGKEGAGPGIRATIGAQYCVAAVVGSRATDFPDATLPGATGAAPGWFLIR